MEVRVSNLPLEPNKWQELCLKCSNLLQTEIQDEIHTFYKQTPVYFQVYQQGSLVGGVRLFLWRSTKTKLISRISSQLTQHGEILVDCDSKQFIEEIYNCLKESVLKYITDKKIVSFVAGNFYGNEQEILTFDRKLLKQHYQFFVSYIDIDKDDNKLLLSFSSTVRNLIRKAQKNGIVFSTTNNVNSLNEFLADNYTRQGKPDKCPNPAFVKKMYDCYSKHDASKIFICSSEKRPLAVLMSEEFGTNCYDNFSGTELNNLGIGQLMQFEVMRYYRDRGYKRYFLGQTARGINSDKKFSEGISFFKRSFKPIELPAHKCTYVFRPMSYRLWTLTVRLYKMLTLKYQTKSI